MTTKYSSWIAESSSAQLWPTESVDPRDLLARERRIRAVQSAMASLPPQDRTVIERVYFAGATLPQIAAELGIDPQSAVNLHFRALRRLRKQLTAFVETEFNLPAHTISCVICSSQHRREIDLLLARHSAGEPYRETIRAIKQRFDVAIVSVMTIVGHRKYHS